MGDRVPTRGFRETREEGEGVIGDLGIEREGEWEFLGHQGEAQAPVRDIADQLGTKQESMPASLAEAWATTAPQAARLGHPDPRAIAKTFH